MLQAYATAPGYELGHSSSPARMVSSAQAYQPQITAENMFGMYATGFQTHRLSSGGRARAPAPVNTEAVYSDLVSREHAKDTGRR
jgi:hypothetical protein